MAIIVKCEQCQSRFRVQDKYAGRSGNCPSCEAPLVVPQLTPVAVPARSLPTPKPKSLPTPAPRKWRVEHDTSAMNSTMSLMTHIPMARCRTCGKNVLHGSVKCYFCGTPSDAAGAHDLS